MFAMRTGVQGPYETSAGYAVLPLLALVRRLRAGGIGVSTGEVLDAARALAAVDLAARGQVRAALRATLVKDASQAGAYERAFDAIFARPRPPAPLAAPAPTPAAEATPAPGAVPPDLDRALGDALAAGADSAVADLLAGAVERWSGTAEGRGLEHHTQRVLRRLDLARLYRRLLDPDPDADGLDRAVRAAEVDAAMAEIERRIRALVAARLGAAPAEPVRADVRDTPLLRARPDELAALRAAVRPLARTLATRLHRQSRRRGRGGADMRRTLRRSISTGGVPAEVVLRRRRPSRPELVVLCDVSGSMAQFAPFTLTLLHAVHQEFRRVRSWVFVDGIVEISELLAAAPGVLDPRHLLDRRGLLARDGRSDYGLAFTRFLDGWPDAVGPHTTVIVAGDARSHDRGPALPQVAELARRSRRLYWLDPEPRADWGSDDSAMPLYARHCTGVFETATLRQLAETVADLR
jgi:uncharacterized protein